MRDTRYLISMLEPACGADVIRLCSQQDWPRVIDAAARHKVLPLLASRAVEAGFASVLPASFAEMLSESSATATSPELTLSPCPSPKTPFGSRTSTRSEWNCKSCYTATDFRRSR